MLRALRGEPREAFHYRDKGVLATIGRGRAVARIGRLQLKGIIAWLAWLFVHILFLIGFRNKVAVLFNWAYSYFTYKLGARIITGWPQGRRWEDDQPGKRLQKL